MSKISFRPLYGEFARAYDLIITGPVSSRCDFIEDMAVQRGVLPGSRILDAGCGTGSYSIELSRRGYSMTGLDASAELISVAKAKAKEAMATVTFRLGNILKLLPQPIYDGILCRGVLNDIINDPIRQQALLCLTRALRKGGVLILDVREWTASVLRKKKEPIFERHVEFDNGTLTFQAVTRLEHNTRRLLITEYYKFSQDDGFEITTKYDFIMQCWTRDELQSCLINAGAVIVDYFGDYDSKSSTGSTDRIVAVASI